MKTIELEELIKKCLDDFYKRRIDKLGGLKLGDTLQKKNPYLFRAIGIQNAAELVEGLLTAYMSSSDEGIFGDAFFEPLAKVVSGGVVAPSEGIDLVIETDTQYKAISVKSGPNIFNASQAKRMNEEFSSLRSRVAKLHKQYDALLGHAYGRKAGEPTATRLYRVRAGQAFWEELTGDSEFYLKIIQLMKDYPVNHRMTYEIELGHAVNRFTKELLNNFASDDGAINWEKILQFNSGKLKMRYP